MNKYILLAGTALFLSAPAISHAQVTTDELNTRLTTAEGKIDNLTAGLKSANTTIDENTSAITDLTTNLAGKANTSDVYTKTEADEKFLTQTEASSTYATKGELDSKANASDVYTKTETDGKFLTQSEASSTYATNEKVNGLEGSLNNKADTSYVDEQLATKANASDVYTKTEADEKFLTSR